MAGYTSRKFLYLTIPSILGLSILWFLKKRSASSKQTSKAVQVESDCPDQYPILYPMKFKNQEVNSGKETVCAEMQLKETETTTEKQSQICNGAVSHNPKVNGKKENMTRLCGNGNSCLADEHIANGCIKDKATFRNGDSKFEITNGMNALSLNGTSTVKEDLLIVKLPIVEMEIVQGFGSKTNGVVKSLENHKSESQAFVCEEKEDFIATNTDAEIKSLHPKDIELEAAKEPQHSVLHMQSSFVCNGSSTGETISHSSSIEVNLTENKLLASVDHMVPVSNNLSSTSGETVLTDTEEHLTSDSSEVIDTNGHSTQSFDSDVATSDELTPHLLYKPVNTNDPSISISQSMVEDNATHCLTSAFNYIGTDIENEASPIHILTDGQLTPPVDYVVTDSTELLTLPVDYTGADTQGEMLESPGATYCDSLVSNDSGRGPSEFHFKDSQEHIVYMVYEFEILPEDCGRLIGRSGKQVKYINKETNANIVIKKHPCCRDKKICAVSGTENEINAALKLIRKRFPAEQFPSVTLSQINSIPISTLFAPETLKLLLPESVFFDSLLCATSTAGHFFLQQPTHPTFHQLAPLSNAMNALYGQSETPMLDNPMKGNVCVAEIAGGWYRAEVDEVYEKSDECCVKFLDYGGYAIVPKASLRQIKCDYMLIPFQATECYLAGVMPLDDDGWSQEATRFFEKAAQGRLIQGCIDGYAENRVPFVYLYRLNGTESVCINQELVSSGLARVFPSELLC